MDRDYNEYAAARWLPWVPAAGSLGCSRHEAEDVARGIAPPFPADLISTARSARRRRQARVTVLVGIAGTLALAMVIGVRLGPSGSDAITRLGRQGASAAAPGDPRSSPTPPAPERHPETRVVTDRDEVIGEWTVLEVARGPVPERAETGLGVYPRGQTGLTLGYSDGVNGHSVFYRLAPDGRLT